MKFTIAVVMMALAVSVQASAVPLAYSLPYSAPLQYAPYQYTPYQYAPSISYTARSLPLAYAAAPAINYEYAAPAINYEYAAPAFRSIAELRSPAAIIPVAAEGTYTAVNKGAIHVAPLPGHSQSASSINLESAPGTY